MSVWVLYEDSAEAREITLDTLSGTTVRDVVNIARANSNGGEYSVRFEGRTVSPLSYIAQLNGVTRDNPLQLFKGLNVFAHGLPPLGNIRPIGSSSSVSAISNHEPASVAADSPNFNIVNDMNIDRTFPSVIWSKHNISIKAGRLPLRWSSENNISELVNATLVDIFNAADLPLVDCVSELSLFDSKRPDIWLVYANGIPVGVVEVKKPISSTSPLQNENNLGQIFDYLMHLSAYTGRRHAFGLLVTYDEWRIVWLRNADNVAVATQSQADTDQLSLTSSALPSEPPDWDRNTVNFPPIPEASMISTDMGNERILHSHRIMKWNDPDLPMFILSCVRKMISSPVDPRNLSRLIPRTSYIYVTRNRWSWDKIDGIEPVPISAECRAPSHFQNAFLLLDLGGGGDGRVWLGSTRKGKLCVLKFFANENALKTEKEVWDKAWPFAKVKATTLIDRPVLVMPWVKPCTEDDLRVDNNKQAAVKAIDELAQAGYVHNDLRPRHVGLYRREGRLKALLFDLARVRKLESQDDKSAEVTKMMDELKIT